MNEYFVNATLLNLRSSPSKADGNTNIVTRLKTQEMVEVIETINDWAKVKCIERNPVITGYVANSYLKVKVETSPSNITFLQPVHLKPNLNSIRGNHGAWQYPLSELNMPKVDRNSQTTQVINTMHEIVKFLKVDISQRYQRDLHTYCNIYAYDYCYLSGVFLPRVWWRGKALLDLKVGKLVEPKYDVTVDEINANSLYSWLEEWGDDYKWTRTYSLDELQNKVNEGRVGVICAPNIHPQSSGHICCVIPENDEHFATREAGKVICPLLSQAGAINLPYYNNNRWWIRLSDRFKDYGYWYCSLS